MGRCLSLFACCLLCGACYLLFIGGLLCVVRNVCSLCVVRCALSVVLVLFVECVLFDVRLLFVY